MSNMDDFKAFETLVSDNSTTEPEFDIPTKCQNCPSIAALQQRIEEARQSKDEATNFSEMMMDGIPEEVKSQLAAHLEDDHREELLAMGLSPDDAVNKMEQNGRDQLSRTLDEFDTTIAGLEQLICDKASNCHGKLKLRAQHDGAEVNVTICGSRAFTSSENPVPANVTRRVIRSEEA